MLLYRENWYDCSSFTSLNSSNLNADKVKDMSNMFYFYSSFTSLNLFDFNAINVKDMSFC
jgi:hypothetical protein